MVYGLPEPLSDIEYRDEIREFFRYKIIPGCVFDVEKVNLVYNLGEYSELEYKK